LRESIDELLEIARGRRGSGNGRARLPVGSAT
jgi:hypothetical protein